MANDAWGNQQFPGYQWDGFKGWTPEAGQAASNMAAQQQNSGNPLDALAALFALGGVGGQAPAAQAAQAAAPTNLPSPMAPGARVAPASQQAAAQADAVPLPPSRPADFTPANRGWVDAGTAENAAKGATGAETVPLPPVRPRTFADTRGWADPGSMENARNPAMTQDAANVPLPPTRPTNLVPPPPRGSDPGAIENFARQTQANGIDLNSILAQMRARRGR